MKGGASSGVADDDAPCSGGERGALQMPGDRATRNEIEIVARRRHAAETALKWPHARAVSAGPQAFNSAELGEIV